jgi:hypothetical protein
MIRNRKQKNSEKNLLLCPPWISHDVTQDWTPRLRREKPASIRWSYALPIVETYLKKFLLYSCQRSCYPRLLMRNVLRPLVSLHSIRLLVSPLCLFALIAWFLDAEGLDLYPFKNYSVNSVKVPCINNFVRYTYCKHVLLRTENNNMTVSQNLCLGLQILYMATKRNFEVMFDNYQLYMLNLL